MEKNEMLERLWSEAQSVEIPPELAPDQVEKRIRTQKIKKQKRFHWNRYGGRVAAAVIVFVASLGVLATADIQPTVPMTQKPEEGSVQQTQEPLQDPVPQTVQDEMPDEDDAADAKPVIVRTLGDYRLADSYEDVSEMIAGLMDQRKREYAGADLLSNAAAEDVSSAEQSSAEKRDFSTTNLQVTGVDESDIVKTDGNYIYIASNDKVQIVDVTGKEPRQLDSITPGFSGNMDRIREMYVADGHLILIIQTEDTDILDSNEPGIFESSKMMVDMAFRPYVSNSVHTKVLTYDITSASGARLMGTFTQDGSYHTSRKIGDRLYVFTDYGYPMMYPYMRADGTIKEIGETETAERTDVEETKQMLPKIQGQTIPEHCIYLPKDGCESGILIASVDVKQPQTVIDQKLIFSGYSSLYVTEDSIILYRDDYSQATNSSCTRLTKFAISDGRIMADCAESVPGNINDTFAIHENRDGYLYVLTTEYTENGTMNGLYVLDQKLKIHGRVDHIADGETVYAARFVDDIGYFVTYRNMDPLFTVDFSDPAAPKLIGELEIPGFSDYLQFWDDTHLIGVGEERKAKDSEFVGIKVSLYDISDPTDVKESSKIVMEDAAYSAALYNYKALLADSKKNVIAFLTEDKGTTYRLSQRIFTVKDGRLKATATDRVSQNNEWEMGSDSYRNLYVADNLYLVREGLVIVYDMSDHFARTKTLKLI